MRYLFVKRLIDVGVAATGLVVVSPILIITAMLIKASSPGPVIFRQPRLGRSGVVFDILKFRTMAVGAPDIRNSDGSTFNAKDDPRLIRYGAVLRKFSIDELPQLWNVLVGEMSLVGGRPDLPDAIKRYSAKQRDRLLVRPGMTSLAIVNGRNNLAVEKRWDLDAWYARNLSFTLDLQILYRTVVLVISGANVINDLSKYRGIR